MRPIYLDYASTTPCDPQVLEAMRPFFFASFGNASSPHQYGRWASKALEEARESLASLIGANTAEIVFTSGASESNNHAIFSATRALQHKGGPGLGRGRHIVASAMEHHSVLEPLRRLEQEGFSVTYVKPQPDGIINPDDARAAVRQDTILVCLHHANNEIGTVQSVDSVGQFCRGQGIYFLVDATQTIGHVPVDVKQMCCDFLSLSAHKFYGPQGVGALYIRQGIDLPPFLLGGDQERGRRAGTQNTAGIAGLGAAVKLCRTQMPEAAGRETKLRERIIAGVCKEISGAVLNGSRQARLPNNAHFSFEGINGEELVSALDMAGLAVSMGSACTWGRLEPSHTLKAIGLSDRLSLGSLRMTVGRWTTEADVDYLLEQLKLKVAQLRGNSK